MSQKRSFRDRRWFGDWGRGEKEALQLRASWESPGLQTMRSPALGLLAGLLFGRYGSGIVGLVLLLFLCCAAAGPIEGRPGAAGLWSVSVEPRVL